MEHTTGTSHEQLARTGSWVIRDDPAGTLTAALTAEIDAAQRLLAAAELLTGDVSFGCWQEHFSAWRTACAGTLASRFEREAATEFHAGTQLRDFPPGEWREAQRAAIEALNDMTQLLSTLRQTIAGRGAPHRPTPGGGANRAGHGGLRDV